MYLRTQSIFKISAIEFYSSNMADSAIDLSSWKLGIEGNFPTHKVVDAVMPEVTYLKFQ